MLIFICSPSHRQSSVGHCNSGGATYLRPCGIYDREAAMVGGPWEHQSPRIGLEGKKNVRYDDHFRFLHLWARGVKGTVIYFLSESLATPDVIKTKKSELRLYCDLLMQQVHSMKEAATLPDGPDIKVSPCFCLNKLP